MNKKDLYSTLVIIYTFVAIAALFVMMLAWLITPLWEELPLWLKIIGFSGVLVVLAGIIRDEKNK